MKNSDIISLIRCGILGMTSHDLPAAEAYKAVKLKMEVQKAFKALSEAEQGVLAECGIEDVEKHNARQQELSSKQQRTEAEQAELDVLAEKTSRANAMTKALRNEDIVLDVTPLDYDTWRRLQGENRAVRIEGNTVDILGGIAEIILHDVFWSDPVEAEQAMDGNV